MKCDMPLPLNKNISGDLAPLAGIFSSCPPSKSMVCKGMRFLQECIYQTVRYFLSHLPNYHYLDPKSHSSGILGVSGKGKVEKH